MRKQLACIFVALTLLGACRHEQQQEGQLKLVYSGEIASLNYLVSASAAEIGLAANLVDSLIEFDRYGSIQPALATHWEAAEDGMTWTFHLRQGVWWYTWQGEPYAEVTADDFVAALEYVLNPANKSKTANIVYRVIDNAEEYYRGESTDFAQVGVRAVDRYTLEYRLKQPVPYFLSMLNYVCFFPANRQFLNQTGDRFGTDSKTLLYNGAYILAELEFHSRRLLRKNEHYWDSGNVFISSIRGQYNAEAAALAPELFLRGEVSFAAIPSMYIDEWMQDPDKRRLVRPGRPSFYTFFYAFNFRPRYDEMYNPDNWRLAANNVNFRKSLFHALNRTAAMLTADPYFPQNRLSNTITPRNFAAAGGIDYTQMGELARHANTESFAPELALAYKKKARAELEGTVTFPVQVVMPYNTGSSDWVHRVQVVEQQLENLLGRDYIEVVLMPHPPAGFLNGTRRAGNYSLMEVNWGPDYADPETYTDPFKRGGNYNFPEYITEQDARGRNLYRVYEQMVERGRAEVDDIVKRYHLFADAEAYLIEQAFVIPYGQGSGGYVASWLNPFDAPYSPFGVCADRFKGRRMLDRPMNMEDYQAALELWQKERQQTLD